MLIYGIDEVSAEQRDSFQREGYCILEGVIMARDLAMLREECAYFIGYTDGALAPPLLAGDTDDTGLDWSIGASVAQGNFEVGVAYIGVEGPSINDFTDDAIVGTISASF